MKRLKYLLIAMITGFMFTSCEKDFNISLPDSGKKIVVNSLFDNTDVISVTVTRSLNPDGTDRVEELKTAKVSLYKDGNFVEQMTYAQSEEDTLLGRFYATIVPVSGVNYKVEAEYTGMEKVTTQSIMPPLVELQVDTLHWMVWNEPQDTINSVRFRFELNFKDPSAENNKYMLQIAAPILKIDTIAHTSEFYGWQYAQILTPDLADAQTYLDNAVLFTDEQFNGTQKTVSGTATISSYPHVDIRPVDISAGFYSHYPYVVDKTSLHFELISLSDDAYLYYKSVIAKIESESDFYAQPAVIYSNVKNVFGIFGAKNVSKINKDVVY
jgi:hypothetical protein